MDDDPTAYLGSLDRWRAVMEAIHPEVYADRPLIMHEQQYRDLMAAEQRRQRYVTNARKWRALADSLWHDKPVPPRPPPPRAVRSLVVELAMGVARGDR